MEPIPKVKHWQIALDILDSRLKGYERGDEPASSAPHIPMHLERYPGAVVPSASTRITPAEVRQTRHLARATAASTETGSVTFSAVPEPEKPISTTSSIRAQRIASHAKGKAPATPTSGDNAAITNADSSKEEHPVQVGAKESSESKLLNECQIYNSENTQFIRAQLAKEIAGLRKVIPETTDTTPRTDSSIPQHVEETPTEQIQASRERLDVLQRHMDLEDGVMHTMRSRIINIGQCLDRLETHAGKTQIYTDKMEEFILHSTDFIQKRLDAADERAARYDGLLELLSKQINPLLELIQCLAGSHFSVLKQVGLINQKLELLGKFPQQEVKEPQEQAGGDVECDTGARNMESDTADFVFVSDDESLFGDLFS